jgi:ankyrin repeat protein
MLELFPRLLIVRFICASLQVPLALALLDDHSSVLDLAKRNSSGYTCMHVACANGCSTVAERIVARRPESLNEPGGSRASTPLHMAAGKGHPDTVRERTELNDFLTPSQF